MKKITTLVLVSILACGILGCGGDKSADIKMRGDIAAADSKGGRSNAADSPDKEAVSPDASGAERKNPAMTEILDAVKEELGKDYWPDRDLTEEEFGEETGLSPDLYDRYLAQKQSVEAGIDTLIIIRTTEENLSDVENTLNEYRDGQLKKWSSHPQDQAKAEASRIETIGSYVCYVQLGADTTAAAKQGDDDIIEKCQDANERALYVIEKAILE